MTDTEYGINDLLETVLIEEAQNDEPWLEAFFRTATFEPVRYMMPLGHAHCHTRQEFFAKYPTASADVIDLVERALRKAGFPFQDDDPTWMNPARTARKAFAQVAAEKGVTLDPTFVFSLKGAKQELSLSTLDRLTEQVFYEEHWTSHQPTKQVVSETMQRSGVAFKL
jgi:hypothetical protein